MQLTPQQNDLIRRGGRLFLEGGAGMGKTTVAVQRMLYLLQSGVPADEILVLVPQRTLGLPYHHALRSVELPSDERLTVTTMSGIIQRMINQFYPLLAERAGFSPDAAPTFLSTETAQYVMAQVVNPLIAEKGYFETVTIERSRLYVQLLDNLSRAAMVGFPISEIGVRLKDTWIGDPAQNHVFDQVQDCANRFRAYCMERSLLDYSLQISLFVDHLWRMRAAREYLGRYRHLIVENVEEDNAAVQDILREWLPEFESALVIYDTEAGYRSFLGSDPDNGYTLRQSCDEAFELDESFVTTPEIEALGSAFARALDQYAEPDAANPLGALEYTVSRYYPEMVNHVADEVRRLVQDEGVPPGEIAILAPNLPDSLRFSLLQRLEGIPVRAHRPSRALREEPASHCLLTLAQLAHPAWNAEPPTFDVAYALMQAIGTLEPSHTLDLVRAQLLAQEAYPHAGSKSRLAPFESLPAETQERVSHVLGERYEALRGWLEEYIAKHDAPPPPAPEPKKKRGRKKKAEAEQPSLPPQPELDNFFSLLFGEVLSQRGFGFFGDKAAADTAQNLIDSARNFRRAFAQKSIIAKPIGQEYVEMVQGGIVANQYLREWQQPPTGSVQIAPAYTFLLNNQPVSYQFWLDVGNRNWFERLYQPLTHPYVLSKQWIPGTKWTDEREYELRRESLYQLVVGLTRRCRKRVTLCISELGENGYENQGELLQVFSRILRRYAAEQRTEEGESDV